MTALKNRAEIFFLNAGCLLTGFCKRIIETALRGKITFVLFSIAFAALTVAALVGIVIGIINIIAVFQRVVDVFRDVSAALFD